MITPVTSKAVTRVANDLHRLPESERSKFPSQHSKCTAGAICIYQGRKKVSTATSASLKACSKPLKAAQSYDWTRNMTRNRRSDKETCARSLLLSSLYCQVLSSTTALPSGLAEGSKNTEYPLQWWVYCWTEVRSSDPSSLPSFRLGWLALGPRNSTSNDAHDHDSTGHRKPSHLLTFNTDSHT